MSERKWTPGDYDGGPLFVRVVSNTGDPGGDSLYAHRFEEFQEDERHG